MPISSVLNERLVESHEKIIWHPSFVFREWLYRSRRAEYVFGDSPAGDRQRGNKSALHGDIYLFITLNFRIFWYELWTWGFFTALCELFKWSCKSLLIYVSFSFKAQQMWIFLSYQVLTLANFHLEICDFNNFQGRSCIDRRKLFDVFEVKRLK